ncbi:MAG: LysR family transcriptional regulator [Gammaproteobacteria bacterium]|nr:LysR family transcriptional regulator [Gammaproteobacteria bacterium]
MIRATFQQLRLFEAVARNASFTLAAREVHLSQPAVSIQVKRLEELVDQRLFEQLGKRLYLTEAGREVYAACTDIFARMGNLEENLSELCGQVSGPLRIAVATTAKYFLPRYLGAFVRQFDRVRPQLKVTNRANILERMDENVDDLYILGRPPEERDVEKASFLEDELVFCASADHPLAGQKDITLEQIAGERLLFREQGSGTRRAFEQHFAELEIPVEPYMELGSGEAIKQAAIAGLGVGMLSIFSLRLELETGRLVTLNVAGMPMHREWFVVYPKGKRLSLAAQRFHQFLLESEVMPE